MISLSHYLFCDITEFVISKNNDFIVKRHPKVVSLFPHLLVKVHSGKNLDYFAEEEQSKLFVDLFCICLCHIVLSVSCSLVVTCWERFGLLALLYVTCCSVFVTFPYCVLGQVWYLIVLIPDLCLLPYFLNLPYMPNTSLFISFLAVPRQRTPIIIGSKKYRSSLP